MISPKQQRFVDEYLIDLNATQAAIRAGYSENSAKAQGSRLLTNADVQLAIQEAQKRRSESTTWSAEKVLQRLSEMADLDAADIVDHEGRILPIHSWPKIWRQSISGVEVVETMAGSGEDAEIAILKKIKWPDRLKNIELLGKHIDVNAFNEKRTLEFDDDSGPLEININRRDAKSEVNITRGK